MKVTINYYYRQIRNKKRNQTNKMNNHSKAYSTGNYEKREANHKTKHSNEK